MTRVCGALCVPVEGIYGLGRVIAENAGSRPKFSSLYLNTVSHNTERKSMDLRNTKNIAVLILFEFGCLD